MFRVQSALKDLKIRTLRQKNRKSKTRQRSRGFAILKSKVMDFSQTKVVQGRETRQGKELGLLNMWYEYVTYRDLYQRSVTIIVWLKGTRPV